MPQEKPLPSVDIGTRLRSALTDDQINILLNILAEEGHLQALDNRLRVVDPDLADTIRRVLVAPGIQADLLPSSQKTLETWNDLWAIWNDHVSEVGDEDGAYVNHEEHWHPPYFDQGALTDALEEAASKLSEWIDRAFPLVNEPNLFLDSLTEINSNMRSYPEWFQPIEDSLALGPRASECVLRWSWLGLANQSSSGQKFVDALSILNTPALHTELDRDICFQFFLGLPESVCRQIHAYLRKPQFVEKLANLRSPWRRIQDEFESRFDPAAHLRACETHLEQDWHYGEPLIADAEARHDFATAERFVEQTMSSLLKCPPDESWCPELQLFPISRYYRPPEECEAIDRLLDRWENIATRLKKTERIASLRLQRTLLKSPENWPIVLTAFQEFQRHSKPVTVEKLFAEWQQRIVTACRYHEITNESESDSWISRLIESQRNPTAHQRTFIEHLDVWLECCQKHAAFFQKNWRLLALLTRNLPPYQEPPERRPIFYSQVLVQSLSISEEMEQSIRNALNLLGDKINRIKVQPVWEEHLHALIPNPEAGGSDYRESALWMKALSEINMTRYNSFLSSWKTEYRRRRNLWRDLATVGCPGI